MSTSRGQLPKAERNRLIRVIHTARRSLGLSDEDYRALLEGVTGKRSCSDMTPAELMRVCDRMRALGFKPTSQPGKKLSPRSKGTPASEDQRAKIRALWIECYHAGVVQDRYENALNAFVKRMTKVERVDWLVRADHCNRVIEALKKMLERAGEGTETDA